jgi:hypothetical protein
VNECVTESPCHTNATCNNTDGSYTCTCDTGYSGDGFSCDGKNRIEIEIAIPVIITKKPDMRNSKLHILIIIDVNECVTESPCHTNATCNNTDGSYTCTCDTGYSGDGFSCDGKSEIGIPIIIPVIISRNQM